MELNTKELQTIFNITPMTVYNWREGVDKKKTGKLPYHKKKVGTRHRIYFKWVEVKKWSKLNKIEVVVEPKDLKKKKKV